MSGVFGIIGAAPAEAAAIADRMGGRMRHTPHQQAESRAVGDGAALGRISIGIFNRAGQPLRSADGAVSLVLCGELYHQAGRRAELGLPPDSDDAQLAMELYLRRGAAGLAELEGAFTIAAWDARAGELTIVNDRFGLYPHYYAAAGGALAFAPEIKGVLAAPGVPRRLDMAAVAQYVRFQQLFGERTWLEDVQLLPPAAVLRYRPGAAQPQIERYWDLDQIGSRASVRFADAVDETTAIWKRAIGTLTAGPQRVGIYLSGGMDGRIIMAAVDQRTPVQTLTFGAAGCRDVVYAAELARRAGRPNRWFPLTDGRWVLEHTDLHLALTEGMHSWMHAHGISTLPAARELIDVNLSGWDGATTLGGFAVLEDHAGDRYYRYPPSEAAMRERMLDAYTRYLTWPGLTDDEAAQLWAPGRDLGGLAAESFLAELEHSRHYPSDRRADYFAIRQLLRRSLQNQIVTARSAFEVRCPYLDYALIDHIYSLPDSARATPQLRRALLTRLAPKLALVPYEKNDQLPHSSRLVREGDLLARKVARRINRVFPQLFPSRPRLYADYEQYLRGELRTWAEGILFDERTLARGLFRPETVRALWDLHQSGRQLWTVGKVAPLITLELVQRQLLDS